MKQVIVFTCLGLLLGGCGKKSSPTAASDGSQQPQTSESTSAAASPNEAPVQSDTGKPLPPPTPTVLANTENTVRASVDGTVDPFLTSQLQIFISQNRRLPQSFNEFARQRLDSMPAPPAGMKWVIDSTDSQVKAVPR
jgi:hypothetical protein